MFSEVLERFIQNSPVAVMVRVLLENLLNADKMDRWFDTVRQSLVAFQELMRPLKFLTLLCRHARRSDPDRPSGISPCGYLRSMFVFSVRCLVSRQCHPISIIISATDSSVWASVSLTTWPPGWMLLTRLKSLQEGATSLWPIGFSVYASRLLFANHAGYNPRRDRSASRARLNTGGWLLLTRQGLSPCKKRQASLDALSIGSADRKSGELRNERTPNPRRFCGSAAAYGYAHPKFTPFQDTAHSRSILSNRSTHQHARKWVRPNCDRYDSDSLKT